MQTRKTWREKMDNPNLPKLVDIPATMQKRLGTGTVLVPHPRDAVTTSTIRSALAAQHGAATTCPLTTGIFVWIAAEAAEESAQAGAEDITPYWRVVKDDGSLNPKFPGGVERQSSMLRHEGHRVLPAKGKKPPRLDVAA